jgi:hypothetical protein
MFTLSFSSRAVSVAPEGLAKFLITPSAPGSGFGMDSDGDEFSCFSLNVNEAEAIEKLFKKIKHDGENTEEQEPTPKNMICTSAWALHGCCADVG